jgi:Tol biopolymer transport system component
MIALSPDGSRIAYVANGQIFLRDLAEREARPVRGTAETRRGAAPPVGAAAPTFSPDGEWLAYVHVPAPAGPFSVMRVPVSGGAPVPIYSASGGVANFPEGLTWPTLDAMLFASAEGIVRIPANGGATEVLVPSGEEERFYSPQLLPGGEAVLFTRMMGEPRQGRLEAAQIVVQSIGRDARTVVWEGGSAARYLPTGHLLLTQGTAGQGTTLFAVPFDPAERAVRGLPVEILGGLRRAFNQNSDAANYAVSDTGTLVIIPGDPNAVQQASIETTLAWVDREGREEPLPVRADDYTSVRISPDGTKIALVIGSRLFTGRPPVIWVFDRQTENLSLLTADPAGDDSPLWSSDGSRVFFRSFRGNTHGVYAIDVDTRETTLIASSTDFPFAMPWTISADDRTLGLVDPITLEDFNIATLTPADGKLTRVLDTEALVSSPSFSPNGAWLAYSENLRAGTVEINIRPFPALSRTLIPVGTGEFPVFSRDGSELFFFDGSGLTAVPVSYEPTLRVGRPSKLFESGSYLWARDGRAWDPDPSGERFLMIRVPNSAVPSDAASRGQIDVVLNWFEELNRRVPVE